MQRAGPLNIATPIPRFRLAFGLVFALFGTLPMVIAIVADGPLAAILFTAPFLIVGLCVAFGRSGFVIDPMAQRIVTWKGIGFPMLRSPHTLGPSVGVSLDRETRGSGKNSRTVFPVRLHRASPGTPIELTAPQDYVAARYAAEAVGKLLQLGMEDRSSGVLVRREAGTLDEPLRERLLREYGGASAPSPQPAGRLQVIQDGDVQECTLPPAGFNATGAMPLVFCVFSLLMPVPIMMSEESWPLPVFLMFGGLSVAIFLLLGVPALIRMFGSSRVRFSATGITYKAPLAFSKEIPTGELEELICVPVTTVVILTRGGSVVARSDRRTIQMGSSMKPNETAWLCDAICYTLVTTAWGYRG